MSHRQDRREPDSMQEVLGSNSDHNAEYFMANYRMTRTLGVGSFGKVKYAEHVLSGHKVAVKVLHRKKIKQMDMEDKVKREIKIMKLFMHPHIIRLYDVVKTSADIYVVCEYVQCGELFDYIVEKGRLEENEARKYFQQIISGVEYCHRNMVVHRDLKPENLLLDSAMNVKIADFGLSNVMRDGHFLKTSCGSPNYAAPEVISGKLYSGPEVDVWSCGVILYALLCGSLPFDDESIPNLFKKIKGGIYNLPSHLSPGARDLIPRMLLVDPLKRITMPEIRQHPWFNLHLPRYLAVTQVQNKATIGTVDPECVDNVVRMGFQRDFVVQSVKDKVHNKATVAYFLDLDFKKGITSNSYLNNELVEAQDPHLQYPQGIMSRPNNMAGMPTPEMLTRVVAERRWQLGSLSHHHPKHIMTKLTERLAAANCPGRTQINWKKGGQYNLRCKWTHLPEGGMSGFIGAAQEVKFEIQLYKVKDQEYCLDIQKLSGELFLFMDVCGQILVQV